MHFAHLGGKDRWRIPSTYSLGRTHWQMFVLPSQWAGDCYWAAATVAAGKNMFNNCGERGGERVLLPTGCRCGKC